MRSLAWSLQVGHFSGLGSWWIPEILLLLVKWYAQHKRRSVYSIKDGVQATNRRGVQFHC